jgi:O-antigen/teichoic acid export membrane protein
MSRRDHEGALMEQSAILAITSRRIIVNTTALYLRSVLTVALGLLSSRWVLGGLGARDYGLYNVVGAIMAFITFVNAVMTASATRHLAYAVGKGDVDETRRWFNASLAVHTALALALITVGWPVGDYCVRHVVAIPDERINACVWVFRLSVVGGVCYVATVPYTALFSAKQCLSEMAAWGVVQTLCLFGFAFLLTRIATDRLVFYATYGVSVSLVYSLIIVARARALFPESRLSFDAWRDSRRIRELLSFGLWCLVGVLGGVSRLQGPAILLNQFFGATVNAAYGVAKIVATQCSALTDGMNASLSPELAAREGRSARDSTMDLALRSCKYGTLMLLLFAVPLSINMDEMLRIWLVTPPEHSSTFCRIILALLVVDSATVGHMMAVNASGKIAGYQLTVGTIGVLSIPLGWYFIRCGYGPYGVGAALLITYVVCSLGRVWWSARILGMSAKRWILDVVLRCGSAASIAILFGAIPHVCLAPSLSQLLLSLAASVITLAACGWIFVFRPSEREFVIRQLKRVWRIVGAGRAPMATDTVRGSDACGLQEMP